MKQDEITAILQRIDTLSSSATNEFYCYVNQSDVVRGFDCDAFQRNRSLTVDELDAPHRRTVFHIDSTLD